MRIGAGAWVGLLVCGLVLAGCTSASNGSAEPASVGSAASSSTADVPLPSFSVPETGSGLRSAVQLTGLTPTLAPLSTSAGPGRTTTGSSPTSTSPTPTTSRSTSTGTVTSTSTTTSTSSAGPTTATNTTSSVAAAFPCPTPSEVGAQDGNVRTAVECYDGNRWLITSGVYGNGEPVDGVSIVHQTAPGVYKSAGGGSDFSGDAADLRAQGIPADLAGHLADGTTLAHQTRYDHPVTDFFATWERHTSELVLNSARTGTLLLGSGCCNSISLPLTISADYDGVLTASVSGAAKYTGTDFSGVQVAVGTPVFLHFEKGASGPVLVSTDPTGQNGGPIVWCGAHYDDRCGA